MTDTEHRPIQQAGRRLRAIATTAPGFAAALINLASDIEAVAEDAGYVPEEAIAADQDPQTWALAVADAVIFGDARRACTR